MKKKIRFIYQTLFGNAEHDFTIINLKHGILILAIPMVLELALESIFALVDLYFVGHLHSSNLAIQTIGLTESVNAIIYSISIGLSVGASAIISRRVGEKKAQKAGRIAMQAICIAVIVSVVLSTIGFCYSEKIFILMGASPQTIAYGILYPKIIFGSSVFILLLFLINGIFRGFGNAAMAMKSLWFANICNIILCPILINGWGIIPPLGIVGAALATAIGRAMGVGYQLYYLFFKTTSIMIKIRYLMPKYHLMLSILKIATPSIIQYLIASCSWIFLAQIVAKTGGEYGSSGFQTAIRIVTFFILPAWGLSNATATLVGQNLGANKKERVLQAIALTAKYNMIFLGLVMLLCFFLGKYFIAILTTDVLIIKIAFTALQIISCGNIFYGLGLVLNNTFNGAGDTWTPTWINFVGFWLFQIPLAYILSYSFELGALGVFIAIPVAETLITMMSYMMYKKRKWLLQKV